MSLHVTVPTRSLRRPRSAPSLRSLREAESDAEFLEKAERMVRLHRPPCRPARS